MGIMKEALIAQKVVIWEGMYAAEQGGDSIGVSIPYSAPFRRLLYDRCWLKGNWQKYDAWALLDFSTAA